MVSAICAYNGSSNENVRLLIYNRPYIRSSDANLAMKGPATMDERITMPIWYAAIPVAAFALLAFASVGSSDDDFDTMHGRSHGTHVWPAPFGIALALMAVWCALGKYEGTLLPLIAASVVALAGGLVASRRDVVVSWAYAEGDGTRVVVRDVACLLVAIVCSVLTLELPWNDTFPLLHPTSLAIECALVAGLVCSLYFLGQRTGGLSALVVILASLAGIVEYCLIRFKGVSLLPSDLLAVPTAFRVRETYSLAIDGRCLMGPLTACLGLCALSLLGRPAAPRTDLPHIARARHSAHLAGNQQQATAKPQGLARVLRALANLAIGLALAAGVSAAVIVPNYMDDLGVELDYWHTVDSYKANGFLTAFVAAAQDFPIKAPEGYTRAKAAEAHVALTELYDAEIGPSERRQAATAQFDAEKPTIIVVMNETFSDLSVYDGLTAGYEGPTYFRSISDALCRGNLAVSVVGGGTCNTEFEFLTGSSLAFVGAGKYPYAVYRMKGDNLAKQLGNLGYITHAVHPADPTNWNRLEVYEDMGFQNFHDGSEFEEAPVLHMGATDAATYNKVLELLKLDIRPQFIFDVTLQNHGGYGMDDIPEELLTSYRPTADVDEETVKELNEYLSCIDASDRDLEAFMGELSKLDRKVVLVFFGDHQPSFAPSLNDLLMTDDREQDHKQRQYQTSYFIWANYDVAGIDQASAADDVSADMLAALTLDLIGAPLSSYQKAQIAARRDVPALNLFGYQGADRVWYDPDEQSDYLELYRQIGLINYSNFGSKVRLIG